MGDASFVRTNFLGGEWSQHAQGRMDRDEYLTALNLCYNGFPMETGAWVRRSGTYNTGPTRRGARVSAHELHFNQISSYVMQFCSNGFLRFTTDGNPVLETGQTITSVSTANPAVVTKVAHGYATGDSIIIYYDSATAPNEGVALLTGRMYRITRINADTFSLQDEVTNANISGAALSGSVASLRMARVKEFATAHAGSYAAITTAQNQNVCLVLDPVVKPYAVDMNWDGSGITFGAAVLEDGPYLDTIDHTVALTTSGTTGSVTLNAFLYDLATPFALWSATDVGRMMRIMDRPDSWTTVANYVVGNSVSYAGSYWIALAPSTNVPPDTDLTSWALLQNAERWTWGTITGFTDSNTVTFLIQGNDFTHALPKYVYRLGLYSDTTGWPSVGTFHSGRFWLSGVQPNRVDGSCPAITNSSTISFAPTNEFGQVADNNAIALGLMATDVAGVAWMVSSDNGLIVGTKGGEWLIQASDENNVLTPTNPVANRVTKYKAMKTPPVVAPMATIFVQSHGRDLIEYVPDGTKGGKFGGRNIAHDAAHLTKEGILKIAYQQNPSPTIWVRDTLSALKSVTYMRESPWASQAPTYAGWAQHAYAVSQGRTTLDIVSGPSPDGTGDAITVITRHEAAASPETSHRVEVFNPMFEEGDAITGARFLDHSRTPTLAKAVVSGGAITGVTLYGLWYLEGTGVTVFFGGVNAGEYQVSSGQITVDVGLDDSLLTEAYLNEFSSSATAVGSAGYGSSLVLGTAAAASAAPVTMTSMTQLMGVSNANQAASDFAVADWERNRLIWWNRAVGSLSVSSLTDGSYVMDAGALINNASQPITFDANYFYVGFQTSGIPHGGVHRYSLENFALVGTVSGFGSVTAVPYNMGVTAASSSGGDICITCGVGNVSGSGVPVHAQNFSSGVALGTVHDVGTSGNSGTVKFSCGMRTPGFLYGLNGPFGSRGFGDNIFLYKYTCAGSGLPSVATLASWTPNDIDPGAVSWGNWDGPVIDEVDGHLLIIIQTDLAYSMLKINSTTGAIIWKLAIDVNRWGNSAGLVCSHQNSRVRFSQLVMLSGRTSGNSCTRNVINTSAGTKTSATYAGVFPHDQCYNDATGHHISFCEYVPDGAGGVSPDPVNYTNPSGWGPPAGLAGRWGFIGPIVPPATNYIVPIVCGYPYTSKGQIVRAILSAESGAANGPAFGKTERIHSFAIRVDKTQDLQVGTSFNELKDLEFKLPGGEAYSELTLFSGTIHDTVNDNYNVDASMLCWQSDGPFPAAVLAIGGFLKTQDR